MQIQARDETASSYLLQSGTVLFGRKQVLSIDLEESGERLTLLIDLEDDPAKELGSTPQIRLEVVDSATAKATFIGPTPPGVTFGPIAIGTIANKKLTAFFSLFRTFYVATLSFSFWLEDERHG